MSTRTTSGKTTLCVLIALSLLTIAGCGYNPEQPVYDTKANPDNFPPEALTLLNGIESGSLNSLMSIATAFGELYTNQPEMLDNQNWHKVIERLGAKFKWFGDNNRDKGLESFTTAGEYYQLASFARPDDPEIREQAALFASWLRAVVDTSFAPAVVISDEPASASQIAAFTRRFIDGTDTDRLFFETYLWAPFKAKIDRLHLLDSAALAELLPIDRVAVIDAGLVDTPIADKIARFTNPAVDLVACQVQRLDTGRVTILLYMVPRENVAEQLSAALRVLKFPAGAPPPDTNSDYRYPQALLTPKQPTDFWPMDEVTRVVDTFLCREPAIAVSVTLLSLANEQMESLTVDGSTDKQVILRFDIPNPGLKPDEPANQH